MSNKSSDYFNQNLTFVNYHLYLTIDKLKINGLIK